MKKLENITVNEKESNYIIPFLWLKGECEDVIREEIEKIYN